MTEIRITRVFEAPRERVWAAWTEPAREVASRFLRRLFSARMDPVEAAMMRDPGEPTTGAGWLPLLAEDVAKDPQRRRSVILLWMNGGPS